MSKKQYDVKNLMISGNTISILGVIGDSFWEESNSSTRFLSEFKALEKKFDNIIVEINSPGGSVFHGLPMYNAISSSKKDITTRNIGMAASMGAILLLAGDTVEAFANALTMMHSPSSFIAGNAQDMREQAEVLDTFENSLISSVANKTGKEVKEIKDLYFDYKDHWLSADEAKDALLIDTIVDQEAELPEDAMNMKMKDIMEHYSNMFCTAEQNKAPIKNFFTNLIKDKSEMKIDAQILNALNLDADAKMDTIVKSIQDMAKKLTDANANLTIEQDAHKTVKDQVTQLTADLETSNTSVTDITSERDTLQKQVKDATTILDTLDASIKDSKDFAKKLEALTSFTDEDETKAFLAKDKNQRKQGARASWEEKADDYLPEEE